MKSIKQRVLFLPALLLVTATLVPACECGDSTPKADAGTPDAATPDAAVSRDLSASLDTKAPDAKAPDAAKPDAAKPDARLPDAAKPDASPISCTGSAGLWSFDENTGTTAKDRSGNGHTFTSSGATWTPGKQGSAFSFTGGSNATTPYTAKFEAKRKLTLTAWIRPNTLGVAGIVVKGARAGATQDWGFYLWNDELGVLFNWPTLGDNPILSTGAKIATGSWVFVAMVLDVDAGTVSFYKDGVFLSKGTWTAELLQNNTDPITIGTDAGTPNDFDGAIDNVGIWTRALSASEIAALYATPTICMKP
ncbi:MAG: LamG domain-containing protein [Deltaproteobacteria bacterium]|nr:LamG domain-containing protein [Deltaproteobacteria bacterium]